MNLALTFTTNMYIKPDTNKTPRSDKLEAIRIKLGQERTPAYGDALRLCRELERELNEMTWQYNDAMERS